MTVWKESPAADVMANILRARHGDRAVACRDESLTGAQFRVVSFREDFTYLWTLEDGADGFRSCVSGKQDGDFDRTLMVVWDGVPSAPEQTGVNVAAYVTPFDWVVTLAWVLRQEPPPLRVLILDLDTEYGKSFGRRAFKEVRQALPWVQFYQPIGVEGYALTAFELLADQDADSAAFARASVPPGEMGAEHLLRDMGIIAFEKWPKLYSLKQTLYDTKNLTEDEPTARLLRQLWVNNLTKAETRHDIGNLLAPLLMSSALDPSLNAVKTIGGTSQLREALFTETKSLGLVTRDNGNGGLPVGGLITDVEVFAPSSGDIFGRLDDVRFLLIDDRFDLGYHHLLGYVLFGNRYPGVPSETEPWRVYCTQNKRTVLLECHNSADTLLNALRRDAPKNGLDWKLPRKLPIEADILLLDLRLWTDEVGQRAFLEQVLGVCEVLQSRRIEDPHFQRSYELARQFCTATPSRDKKVEPPIGVLSLFPLLLSHYDPSFPIVLFTSTHQRDVVEAFRDHPNVITNFSKPIASGYVDSSSVRDRMKDLRKAIVTALRLHEMRFVWSRICQQEQAPPLCFVYERRGRKAGPVERVVCNPKGNPPVPWIPFSRPGETPIEAKIERPQFQLQGDKLKKALAGLYLSYLLRGNYYDGLSAPWEFVESNSIPQKVLDDPHWGNPDLLLPFAGHSRLDPKEEPYIPRRNHLLRALQLCRHRKAHGIAARRGEPDAEYRNSAIFGMLLLLDALRLGTGSREATDQPLRKICGELKSNTKLSAIYSGGKLSLSAHKLINFDMKFGLFAALAFSEAAAYAYEEQNRQRKSYLSNEALTAVVRLVDSVSSVAGSRSLRSRRRKRGNRSR